MIRNWGAIRHFWMLPKKSDSPTTGKAHFFNQSNVCSTAPLARHRVCGCTHGVAFLQNAVNLLFAGDKLGRKTPCLGHNYHPDATENLLLALHENSLSASNFCPDWQAQLHVIWKIDRAQVLTDCHSFQNIVPCTAKTKMLKIYFCNQVVIRTNSASRVLNIRNTICIEANLQRLRQLHTRSWSSLGFASFN